MAFKQGIIYFDSAKVYADSEVYYGSVWRKLSETRREIFQASKSAGSDKFGASILNREPYQFIHYSVCDTQILFPQISFPNRIID